MRTAYIQQVVPAHVEGVAQNLQNRRHLVHDVHPINRQALVYQSQNKLEGGGGGLEHFETLDSLYSGPLKCSHLCILATSKCLVYWIVQLMPPL